MFCFPQGRKIETLQKGSFTKSSAQNLYELNNDLENYTLFSKFQKQITELTINCNSIGNFTKCDEKYRNGPCF